MKYEDITHRIIGAAYKVFNELGFGFLESVYQKALIIELKKNNLRVEAEKPLSVYYDEQIVGDFYVDLFIEDEIIVELKSVQNLAKEYACPVECLRLFNWGSTASQLSERIKEGCRAAHQLWSFWSTGEKKIQATMLYEYSAYAGGGLIFLPFIRKGRKIESIESC